MGQLIMRWKNDGTDSKGVTFPDGVELKRFTEMKDGKRIWLDIVSYMYEGEDVDVYAEEDFFKRLMTEHHGFREDQCFFLFVEGQPAATVTAITDDENKEGYVHMVSVKPSFRGRGLGTLMNTIVLDIFKKTGMRTAYLTTDDWRIPAIKSYLRAGFIPDTESEPDFFERWETIFGIIKET